MKKELENRVLYFHINMVKYEIFYVGIGDEYRPYEEESRSQFWHNTAKKYGYQVIVIETGLNWEDVIKKEIYWIKRIGRRDLNEGTLVNLTDGGDGNPNMSQEIKDKISKSNKGKIKTEEHRDKLSKSLTGKIKTKEHRKNISNAGKGKKLSEERRKIISENLTGRECSTETRNIISNAGKERSLNLGLKISKYKGITWKKERNKWRASIKNKGKAYFIGYFDDEEEAFKKYNEFVENNIN